MTTTADDTADEAAFEALLAGRPVSGGPAGLAAFTEAVRVTATTPGRPSAALADLLATGLLTDQSSPSTRTAPSAGSSPRRSRVRRRRLAMFFPALIVKFLSLGAVAQAATGAGIAVVVVTTAGSTGLLGDDVQSTISTAVGADSGEVTTPDAPAVDTDVPPTAAPGDVDGTAGETTVPVEPVQETLDPQAWVDAGPADYKTFGEWVSASAHNDELRQWLRSQGKTFGSMVRDWAHQKGLDDTDLAEEGVDPADLSDDSTTEPVTGEAGAVRDDQGDDTQVAATQHGSGKRSGTGASSNSNSGKSQSGNGGGKSNGGGNSGHGHN